MAGIKISALPKIITPQLTDYFPIDQSNVTGTETLNQVMILYGANIQISSPAQITGLGTAALKAASNNALPTLASVNGATTINDVAIFSDTAGTVSDSGQPLSNFALLTGAVFSGTVTLNGTQASNNDAATIGYVNSVATGLNIKAAVYAGTTANLVATYNNGSSGVGASLTNSSTLAAFSTDGVSPPVNSRILVKNQSVQADNGIYTLTTIGSPSVAWVLTRSTDYDTAAQIKPGDLVIVQNGTTLSLTSWIQTNTVTTVGTDAISFTQFSVSPASLGQAAFKAVTDNTKTTVASVSGSFTTNHLLAAADTAGTIKDGGSPAQFLLAANNLSDLVSAVTALVNLGLGTPTGTGNVVLQTSPSILNPRISTVIDDVNGNIIIGLNPSASAVNYPIMQNAATGNAISIGAAGSDSNIIFSLLGKGTGGAQIQGTSGGGNASSGYVGELINSNIPFASAVSLPVSGTSYNITSISLSAGDWDIYANVFLFSSAGTMTGINAWVSTTSATPPDNSLISKYVPSSGAITVWAEPVPFLRVNVTTTTTVYLSVNIGFTSTAPTGCGNLTARRVR